MALSLGTMLWYIILAILSAVPLHFAAIMLGGRTTLLKTVLVNILCAFILSLIASLLGNWAVLISFLAVIIVYKIMFDLGWLRALLVLIVQGLLVLLFRFIGEFFGVKFIGFGHSWLKF